MSHENKYLWQRKHVLILLCSVAVIVTAEGHAPLPLELRDKGVVPPPSTSLVPLEKLRFEASGSGPPPPSRDPRCSSDTFQDPAPGASWVALPSSVSYHHSV